MNDQLNSCRGGSASPRARRSFVSGGLALAAMIAGPLVSDAAAERRPLPPLTRIRLFNGTPTHRPQSVEVSIQKFAPGPLPQPEIIADAKMSGDLKPGGIYQMTSPTLFTDVVEVRMKVNFLDAANNPDSNDLTLSIPTGGSSGNPGWEGDSALAADFIWVNGGSQVLLKGRLLYRTDRLSVDGTVTEFHSMMNVRYNETGPRAIHAQNEPLSSLRPVLTDLAIYNGSGRPMLDSPLTVAVPAAQFQIGVPPLKDVVLAQTASGASGEVFEMLRAQVVSAGRVAAQGTLTVPPSPPPANEPLSWDIPTVADPLPANAEIVGADMLVGVDGQATNNARTAFHAIYFSAGSVPLWKFYRSPP